jgi:L-serine dehydratase
MLDRGALRALRGSQELESLGGSIDIQTKDDGGLVSIAATEDARAREAAELLRRCGAGGIKFIDPLYFLQQGTPPFVDAEGMAKASAESGRGLGEIGLEYESKLLGFDRETLVREMLARYRVMKQSAYDGLNKDRVDMDILEPSAPGLMARFDSGTLPVSGVSGRASILAMAVMHTCNSKGVVCAAPTGGSAGVIPGVVMSVAEEKGSTPEQIALALFAAGAVGLVVAKRATFAAEVAGCQVEIGVAGAMAAAAVVEMYGGTADEALSAAAISLQNTMGSVCDPVKGGCEIPCHSRNAASASSAFTSAALSMGGYRNPIPLDETIDASYEVGKSLPPELRCTALGGIAIAPSARKI